MLEQALKKYFGYPSFRESQKEIIQSLLMKKDTLGILPTGNGKSLCYQLTGYLQEGLVVIVAPLISLMEDQVSSLLSFGEKRAVALNSTLKDFEKGYILQRLEQFKFLFLSPEMLSQPHVLQRLKQQKIALFVVDEAHCVSQWGIDFRPEYRNLGVIKAELNHPVTLALTATANAQVEADIKRFLIGEETIVFRQSANRSNIALLVEKTTDKEAVLEETLKKIAGATIIYCATRKQVERLYDRLKVTYSVGYYHGGLDYQQRSLLQKQFHDQELHILIATNAFGMGINKSDIRYVIHYDLPDSMENYIQEIGRAGRDQEQSYSLLLYQPGDEQIHRFFHQSNQEKREHFEQMLGMKVENVFDELQLKWHQQGKREGMSLFLDALKENEHQKQKKLQQMLQYIETLGCRRAFLLAAMGENNLEESICCDFHGATIPDKSVEPFEIIKNEEDWQAILQRMFKE